MAPKRDPKTKKRKDESESEEEESEEESPRRDKRNDVKKVRQLKSKHRPPCMFGKKCYR